MPLEVEQTSKTWKKAAELTKKSFRRKNAKNSSNSYRKKFGPRKHLSDQIVDVDDEDNNDNDPGNAGRYSAAGHRQSPGSLL